MDAKIGSAAATSNTNSFEPLSDFLHEDSCDTLLLYLPGFTKDQLRVQLTRSGVLKISGTRPLGDNKWNNFQKDFPVSANCHTNKITAKYEDGILYVRQPKLIVPAEKQQDQKPPPAKTPADEPLATSTKTHQPDHKPAENNKEVKPTKDEHKVNEPSQGTKKDDQIRNNTPETNDDHKAAAMMSSRDDDKREELSGKNDTKHQSAYEGTTRNNIGKLEDKHEKLSGKNDTNHLSTYEGTTRNDIGKLDDYKTPAARLKTVRRNMTTIVAVILAFALGMFIRNLSWFSMKAEES